MVDRWKEGWEKSVRSLPALASVVGLDPATLRLGREWRAASETLATELSHITHSKLFPSGVYDFVVQRKSLPTDTKIGDIIKLRISRKQNVIDLGRQTLGIEITVGNGNSATVVALPIASNDIPYSSSFFTPRLSITPPQLILFQQPRATEYQQPKIQTSRPRTIPPSQNTISVLKRQNDDEMAFMLEKENAELKQRTLKQNEEIDQLKKVNVEMTNRLADVGRQLESKSLSCAKLDQELKSTNTELKSTNTELKSTNTELKTVIVDLKSRISALESANTDLKSTNSNLIGKLSQSMEVTRGLEQQLAAQRALSVIPAATQEDLKNMDKLARELVSVKASFKVLQGQYNDCHAKAENCDAAAKQAIELLLESEKERKTLVADNTRYKSENDTLIANITRCRTEMNLLESKNTELNQLLMAVRKQTEENGLKMEKSLDQYEKSLDEYETQRKILVDENTRYKNEKVVLTADISRCKTENARFIAEINRCKTENAAFNAEIARRETDTNTLQAENTRLLVELNRIQTEKGKLHTYYNSLLNAANLNNENLKKSCQARINEAVKQVTTTCQTEKYAQVKQHTNDCNKAKADLIKDRDTKLAAVDAHFAEKQLDYDNERKKYEINLAAKQKEIGKLTENLAVVNQNLAECNAKLEKCQSALTNAKEKINRSIPPVESESSGTGGSARSGGRVRHPKPVYFRPKIRLY